MPRYFQTSVTGTMKLSRVANVFNNVPWLHVRRTEKMSEQAKSTIGYLSNSCASCSYCGIR